MFFQAIMYVLLFIGFCFVMWKFIIEPILKDKGIVIEEEKEIKTAHTKELDRLREELKKAKVNEKAADEIEWLQKQIKQCEDKIADSLEKK